MIIPLHHQKHHQAYVTGANALLEKFNKAGKDNADLDMKASLKELPFTSGVSGCIKSSLKIWHPQVLVAEGYRKVQLMQSSGNSTGSKRSLPRLLQMSKDRVGR